MGIFSSLWYPELFRTSGRPINKISRILSVNQFHFLDHPLDNGAYRLVLFEFILGFQKQLRLFCRFLKSFFYYDF